MIARIEGSNLALLWRCVLKSHQKLDRTLLRWVNVMLTEVSPIFELHRVDFPLSLIEDVPTDSHREGKKILYYTHIISHKLMHNIMHFLHLFISLLKDKCANIIILGATSGENIRARLVILPSRSTRWR